ncbi:MAG: glutamate formimidoyltransferase [Candidatus Zixiibacteriota bacterium]
MPRIVECVPNFSEGRRPEIISSIADAIARVETAKILDIHSDLDHNRSVITYICRMDYAVKTGFSAIKKAAELIDMTTHQGVHPRIGACDVFPFVPLDQMTMDEAVDLAGELGKKVGSELNIPVYLYEFAATNDERKNLANIRRGQYEGLSRTLGQDLTKVPDFGPNKMNRKAGATAIGARQSLIAFNAFLETTDKRIGTRIANLISESRGGLQFVRSLAFEIKSRNQIQISMNLTNYMVTSMSRVYNVIEAEADRLGVKVASSEIVGLIPFDAAADLVNFVRNPEGYSADKILEERIKHVSAVGV